MTESTEPRTVQRRTVLRAAAWAAPVVAVAVATPASAASTAALEVFFEPASISSPFGTYGVPFTIGVRNNGTVPTGAVRVVLTYDFNDLGVTGPYPGVPAFANAGLVYTTDGNGTLTITSISLAPGEAAGANLRADSGSEMEFTRVISAVVTVAEASFPSASGTVTFTRFAPA